MCLSSARLIFGITVGALPLMIAARVDPRRRRVVGAINSVATLRETGQLELATGSTALLRVPGEVWEKIKTCAVDLLWVDEEHALASELHEIGREDCRCTICARATERTRLDGASGRRELSHMYECEDCAHGLWEVDGTGGLIRANDRAIGTLLKSFDLVVAGSGSISSADSLEFDARASVAIGLPNFARATTDVPHGGFEPSHELVEIDPVQFILPADAQFRFTRFLSIFKLSPTSETSGKVTGGHSFRKKRGRDEGKKTMGTKGPAAWLLWSDSCACD